MGIFHTLYNSSTNYDTKDMPEKNFPEKQMKHVR